MRHNTERAGFTLMETLIVVGLVALLSLGIAGVFNTVGDTIARGKRVSELNRTAAQIERIMRRDFEQMTREGTLVIRNAYANFGAPVSLFDPARYEGTPQARARRVDEIAFFAHSDTGEFQTARRAMHPDLVASASDARVYYGHGIRQTRPFAASNTAAVRNNSYYRPWLADPNLITGGGAPARGLGVAGPAGSPNPNEYAADWGLLRHVLLMVTPEKTETAIPVEMVNTVGGNTGLLKDSKVQVAMQPAVQSPFRMLSREVPRRPADIWSVSSYRVDPAMGVPWLTSGVVDITTSDLGHVQSVVNHFDVRPQQFRPRNQEFKDYFDPRVLNDRYLMQLWILETFPANPDRAANAYSSNHTRMRFEYEPPLLTITEGDLSANVQYRELERAYRQADQEMLPASLFVGGCTEFIVEWTYGLIDDVVGSPTYGQLIWYGLPRYEDVNGNGVYNANADPLIAQPFTGVNAGLVLPRLIGGKYRDYWNPPSREWYYPTRQLINADLPIPSMQPGAQTEISFFGFYDPGPLDARDDRDDESWNHDNWTSNEPVENPADDRPWLWPSMIRVTMTLAERDDPTSERTYQVIFSVPGGGLDNK